MKSGVMSALDLPPGPADKSRHGGEAFGTQSTQTDAPTSLAWVNAICAAFAVGLIFVASLALFATYNKALSDAAEDLGR